MLQGSHIQWNRTQHRVAMLSKYTMIWFFTYNHCLLVLKDEEVKEFTSAELILW